MYMLVRKIQNIGRETTQYEYIEYINKMFTYGIAGINIRYLTIF